jgi:hypothetical protein
VAGPSSWSIRPPPQLLNTKKRKAAEVTAKEAPPAKRVKGDVGEKEASAANDSLVTGPRVGIGNHETEEYRAFLIPFEKYKDTNFMEDEDAVVAVARTIVSDMTHHFDKGLIIPKNAPRDFRG